MTKTSKPERKTRPVRAKPINTTTTSSTSSLDKDFIIEKYEVKLINAKKIKNMTDLTYNETALKILLLRIELDLENYTLTRLSLMRKSLEENPTQITPKAPTSKEVEKQAEKNEIEASKTIELEQPLKKNDDFML